MPAPPSFCPSSNHIEGGGNPAGRFLASVLSLQSAHPGSALFVAPGDLNLQTKLSAVRLPFIELPD